jgi:hypothetical protein
MRLKQAPNMLDVDTWCSSPKNSRPRCDLFDVRIVIYAMLDIMIVLIRRTHCTTRGTINCNQGWRASKSILIEQMGPATYQQSEMRGAINWTTTSMLQWSTCMVLCWASAGRMSEPHIVEKNVSWCTHAHRTENRHAVLPVHLTNS